MAHGGHYWLADKVEAGGTVVGVLKRVTWVRRNSQRLAARSRTVKVDSFVHRTAHGRAAQAMGG